LSLTLMPVLRARLNEKFARGAENQALLVEAITGIQTVKASALEPAMAKRWDNQLAAYVSASFKTSTLASYGHEGINLIGKIVGAATLWYGARLVMEQELSVGQFIAFNMFAQRVAQPIMRMAQLWTDFQQTGISMARLGDILNTGTEAPPSTAAQLPPLKGRIQLDRVTFRYRAEAPPVMHTVSLDIRAGEVIGTYVVNVTTDVVTENAGEGTDTVLSAVTLTLGNNVENLTLTGSNTINATGNALNNTLLGNSGANVLTGAAGDDIYNGGAGNDTFTDSVTTSNDTYQWGTGSGLDTLTDAGGSLDHVDLNAGIAKSQLKFVKSANDLQLSVIGQNDKLTIKNWYVGTANQIEEFRLSDGSMVMASEVQGLLSALAAIVPMDSTTLPVKTGFIDLPISNPLVPPQAWM